MVQRGEGDGPPLSFWYVAVFWNDFAFGGKPLVFCKRWGIFYGWWCCWRSVTSPNMVAVLATFLDFIKNKNNQLNRITNHEPPPPPLYVQGLSLKVLKFWLFMICFTFLCSLKSKFQFFFQISRFSWEKLLCENHLFSLSLSSGQQFFKTIYLFLISLFVMFMM